MDLREIIIMAGSSFGTMYRSVFSTQLDSIKKFLVSLFFSAFCGLIIIKYSEEHALSNSIAIIISLVVGLISHNIAQAIMSIGNNSEINVVDAASKTVKDITKKYLSGNNDQQNNSSQPDK